MKFINKIIKSKGTATIIAFIVCVAIIFVAYTKRVDQAINAISIPVAARDLDARTQISEVEGADYKIIKVASSMITNDVIVSAEKIKGKYVNYNTFIPKGSLFYTSAIVEWEHMPDSTWSGIDDGKTIVSLPVNTKDTMGNSIYPGDKIDLYYTTTQDGKLVVGKLISGIEVLAVKDENGSHIFKKGPGQNNAAALIFAVDEDYHLLLRKAQYLDGDLFPVQRNYGNENIETTVTSEYLKTLITSQTLDLKPDVIDEVLPENGTTGEVNTPNITE